MIYLQSKLNKYTCCLSSIVSQQTLHYSIYSIVADLVERDQPKINFGPYWAGHFNLLTCIQEISLFAWPMVLMAVDAWTLGVSIVLVEFAGGLKVKHISFIFLYYSFLEFFIFKLFSYFQFYHFLLSLFWPQHSTMIKRIESSITSRWSSYCLICR